MTEPLFAEDQYQLITVPLCPFFPTQVHVFQGDYICLLAVCTVNGVLSSATFSLQEMSALTLFDQITLEISGPENSRPEPLACEPPRPWFPKEGAKGLGRQEIGYHGRPRSQGLRKAPAVTFKSLAEYIGSWNSVTNNPAYHSCRQFII